MKKGVSPAVSFALTLTIIVITAMGAYLWASVEVIKLGEAGKVASFRNQMIGLDYVIRSAAHGDVNFQSSYQIHHPDAILLLGEGNETISLTFIQNAKILGAAYTLPSGRDPDPGDAIYLQKTCSATSEFLFDNSTRISMYRQSNMTRVFEGSRGGAGTAEFMICYYDIDLQFGNKCSKGGSGPGSIVLIKKTNVIGSTPVISIDIC